MTQRPEAPPKTRSPATGRALATAVAAVLVALPVTACAQDGLTPDPAVCKAALQAEYLKSRAGDGHFGAVPAVCKNLPKAEVQRFILQVRTGQ